MGSSAPKSETVVKGGKPQIIREYVSPEYLKELSNLARFYGERAQQTSATRQSNVNRYLSSYGESPVYDPYTTSEGRVIKPYQAPDIYDASKLVEAAEEGGMFGLPSKKGMRNPRKEYNDAIKMRPFVNVSNTKNVNRSLES